MKRTKLKLLEQVHMPSLGKAMYGYHRVMFASDTTASYSVLIGSKIPINSFNIPFKNFSVILIRSFSHRRQINLLELLKKKLIVVTAARWL